MLEPAIVRLELYNEELAKMSKEERTAYYAVHVALCSC